MRARDDLSVSYFRSDVDTLRTVYSSSSRGLQRFCDSGESPSWGPSLPLDDHTDAARANRKRGAERFDGDDDGHDTEGEDGDSLMPLAGSSSAHRMIKNPPKRRLAVTQSLPVGAFRFSGDPAPVVAFQLPGPTTSRLTLHSSSGTLTAADTADDTGVDFGEFFDKEEGF